MARVDPGHGGEVLDLIDLTTGRQLLGRRPFGSADPAEGPLDEVQWIEGWRGGWQVCLPNPGNRCEVDGSMHGFHGTASHEPWAVLDADERSVSMRWAGFGIEALRQLAVDGDCLRIETTVNACGPEPVPYCALEHISLGLEVLDPVLELDIPAAPTMRFRTGMARPVRQQMPRAGRWQSDSTIAPSDVDRVELRGAPYGRFLSVQQLPEGRAVARGYRAGLELTWDASLLPNVWVWYELRASGGAFRNLAEIVAIEPCSVPHSLGLARAIREGQASLLEPGATATYEITARVLTSS